MIEVFSKSNCPACVQVKAHLDKIGKEYVVKDVTKPDIREELFTRLPDAKSVPQVFLDGAHVSNPYEIV